MGYTTTFNTKNTISDMSLSEQVKSLQNSIYLIEIIDTKEKSNSADKPKPKRRR
jgi:hypothetical protein